MGFIEKIIEKYYVDKFKQFISQNTLKYIINKRFIDEGNCIKLQVKKWKYNDKQYSTIWEFYKRDALIYLTNQKETIKYLESKISEYLEEERV